MDTLRRAGALVAALLVLQLTLVAGVVPCVEPAPVAEAGHSGMSMPADSESCRSDAAGTDCAQGDNGVCLAVMSCVVPVFTPSAQALLADATAPGVALPDAITLFQTRSTTPDLPPPRA